MSWLSSSTRLISCRERPRRSRDHRGDFIAVGREVDAGGVGDLAQVERHVGEQVGIALGEGEHHEEQLAARLGVEPADHAQVEQPDPAVGPEHVPRVRVGVEEAVLEDLLVVGLHQLAGRLGALGALRRLEQRHAAYDLVHDQQPARGDLAMTSRDGDAAVALNDLVHPDDVARLLAEVELVAQRARHLFGQRGKVDDPVQLSRAPGLADDHLEQREVRLHHLLGLGALDFDHHGMPIGHPGPVHLSDRPGGERLRVDIGEDVLPRHGELALHHPHDVGLGHRRDVRLQRGEFGHVLRGDQVRACGEDLAELAERRPELFERLPQPTRALSVAVEPQQPPGELAHAHRPEDAPDLPGALPARPGVGSGRLGDGLPGGGVDHHHGAAGEMRDPVGDVAEQETLASPHPRAADDDNVGVRPRRRLEDHRGDIVPRLDHGPSADPLGRQRALERFRETRELALGPLGGRRAGRLGDVRRAVVVTRGVDLGGLRVRRDHLDCEQVRVERAGEGRRPLDRERRPGAAVGGHGHEFGVRGHGARICRRQRQRRAA